MVPATDMMDTPQWWLLAADSCCTDCGTGLPARLSNTEQANICADGGDGTTGPSDGGSVHTVSWGLANVAAASVVITTGDTVTWVVDQQGGHNVVSGLAWGDSDYRFSSPYMTEVDDAWNHTFDESGSYPYYCAPHENMVAVITVVDPDPASIPPAVAFVDNLLADPSFEGTGAPRSHLGEAPATEWTATGTTGFAVTSAVFEAKSGTSAAKVTSIPGGCGGVCYCCVVGRLAAGGCWLLLA